MIKWMNQLIIRNKCHWIQNSSVTVKKGAITLASPINIYNKVVFIYMFPHVNSLVLFPLFLIMLWPMNIQCEIQIIAPSMFIWIIVPLHHQIYMLSVFECSYMYMGSHTQINVAVVVRMCGAPNLHILVCASIQALTHLRAKAWLTIFQFKYV